MLPDIVDKPLGLWIAPDLVNHSLRSIAGTFLEPRCFRLAVESQASGVLAAQGIALPDPNKPLAVTRRSPMWLLSGNLVFARPSLCLEIFFKNQQPSSSGTLGNQCLRHCFDGT